VSKPNLPLRGVVVFRAGRGVVVGTLPSGLIAAYDQYVFDHRPDALDFAGRLAARFGLAVMFLDAPPKSMR
jgi:hypothetical protein